MFFFFYFSVVNNCGSVFMVIFNSYFLSGFYVTVVMSVSSFFSVYGFILIFIFVFFFISTVFLSFFLIFCDKSMWLVYIDVFFSGFFIKQGIFYYMYGKFVISDWVVESCY